MPLPKPDQRYTYQDYLTWDDEQRWEIIDGYVYNMSPAPSINHQTIVVNLTRLLDTLLINHKYRLFVSPTDVVLSENDVVQPDIIVVCESDKITDKNIQGAPTVVIEILSPSTSKKDRIDKRNLYERSGVKEYLLVVPEDQYVECQRLGPDKQFKKSVYYTDEDELKFESLKGMKIAVTEIFKNVG